MTSTTINEPMMIDYLKTAERPDNETKMSTGALMVLVDAFDRKVTRAQFVAMASAALTCVDNIGRVCVVNSILSAIDTHGGLTRLDVEIAKQDVDGYLKHSSGELLKAAHLLKQMANDEDPIH